MAQKLVIKRDIPVEEPTPDEIRAIERYKKDVAAGVKFIPWEEVKKEFAVRVRRRAQ